MRKWKLGKLAVATGIAAMALAFSGVIEPAGVGSIPQKVYAAVKKTGSFTIDATNNTFDDGTKVEGAGEYDYNLATDGSTERISQ